MPSVEGVRLLCIILIMGLRRCYWMFEKLSFIIPMMVFLAGLTIGLGVFCLPFVEKGILTAGQQVGIVVAAGSCFAWYTLVSGKIVK